MDTADRKLYPLPFLKKKKTNLKIKLFLLLGSLSIIIRSIYLILTWEEQQIFARRAFRWTPEGEIGTWIFVLLGFIYMIIKFRNDYLKMTDTHIEKKFYSKTKKVQWTEIQDVEKFDKAIDQYGTEIFVGPSVGILLKDQSNPWRNHTNDAGKYYFAVFKSFFDDIDIDKLYLTIKNQVDKHNSNSVSANGSQQTKPS